MSVSSKAYPVFPILLINFIGTLGYSIILPFLVVLVLKLGGNEVVYGILGATYSFFQLIGAPVLGTLSDKYGRKKILLVSQAGTLLGWLIFLVALYLPVVPLMSIPMGSGSLFVLNLPLLLIFIARFADGITGGNISVANAYLADISAKEDRKRNFGKMAASANIGLIFGPVLAGILGATSLGTVLPVIAATLISLAAIFVIFIKLKNVPPKSVKEPDSVDKTNKLLGHEHKECYKINEQKVSLQIIFAIPYVPFMLMLYFLIFLAFNFFYVAFPVWAAQHLHWTVLKLVFSLHFLALF